MNEGLLERRIIGQFEHAHPLHKLFQFVPQPAVEQEGPRPGLGGVADKLHAILELARQEAKMDQTGRAVDRQVS